MRKHKWIQPAHQGHKQTLYDITDLDGAFERLKKEDLPE